MEDTEFAGEVETIHSLNERDALLLYVHTITERRQLSAVQHAILVGEAFIVANEKGWVPKGAEAKEWARTEFGYSMSHLKRYRKMAKDRDGTLKAQQFVMQHRDEIQARCPDVKLAEPGSMQLAQQAVKAYEAHTGATSGDLSDAEAWCRVDSALSSSKSSVKNSPKQQCQILAVLVATLLARHPQRIRELQSVLLEDDQQYGLRSLSELLGMAAETRTPDYYSELFHVNEEREFADCDWLRPPPAPAPKTPKAKKPAPDKKPKAAKKSAEPPPASPADEWFKFPPVPDADPDAS